MKRGIRLGCLFGIEIRADFSLLFLVVLLTWSLYLDLVDRFADKPRTTLLVAALGAGAAFIGSVVIHELSHSVVALRRGFEVRRIRLFMFGGMSEIGSEAKTPRDEFAVTIAGPAASLVLGVLFLLAAWAVPASWNLTERLTLLLGLANVAIAVFNMLPGFPLDGGRILRAVVWRISGDRRRATAIAATTGRLLGLVLILGGMVYWMVQRDLSGLWLAAIGWFLLQAASLTKRRQEILDSIEGLRVGDVMRRVATAVPGDQSVADVLALHGWGDRLRMIPVEVHGRIRGLLGSREVAKVDAAQRSEQTAASAMTPIGPEDVFDAGASLEQALTQQSGSAGVMVVVEDGRVVGLVTGEEIAAVLGEAAPRR